MFMGASVSAKNTVPTKRIAPGVDMPMVGIGTWQYNDSVAYAAVKEALALGYEHIDTALGYDNQAGIARAMAESGRKRSSYFVTSKIPGGLNMSSATAALELSLKQLQTSYVDLMLVHFPATWGGQGGKAMRIETWKALEAFHKAGKARAIGVSHYCQRHLEDIINMPDRTVPIAVNQVQFHVGMGTAGPNATDDRAFCDAHGIQYESFSPLCGPCGTTALINGSLVTGIGKKYNKSGAQVALRWQVQLGIPVIPKTHKKAYMLENADLFDWKLDADDMAALTQATVPPVAGDPGPPATSGDCSVP